jgi:hypothetical protein
VRLKPAFSETLRHVGSKLPRLVRIEVLTKHARPPDVAALYRGTLEREALPVFKDSPGSISWEYRHARLVVSVGPREQIEPTRLHFFEEYPKGRRFSFPMPSVVEAQCQALIGAPKHKGTPGDEMFASGLGDHDRDFGKQPHTLIPACVAWYAGERYEKPLPRDRRPRVAKIVNDTLLAPLGKNTIADNPYSSADPIWKHAKEVGPRFERARLFVQDDERDAFRRELSKAPV